MRAASNRIPKLYVSVFYLWATMLITLATGFMFWLVAARLYPPDEVGLASGLVSLLFLAALMSQGGLGFGASNLIHRWEGGASEVINASVTSAIIFAIVSGVSTVLIAPLWIADFADLREPWLAGVFIAAIGALSANLILDQCFVSLRRAHYVALKDLSVGVSRVAFTLILIPLGGTGIVLAVALSALLGLALSFVLARKALPGFIPIPRARVGLLRVLLPYSATSYLAELFLAAPRLVLPLLVLRQLGPTMAGYFVAPWMALFVLYGATGAVSNAYFAEGIRRDGNTRHLFRQGLLGAGFVSVIGVIALVLVGDKFLLLYGKAYSFEASNLLRYGALMVLPVLLLQMIINAARVNGDAFLLVTLPLTNAVVAVVAAVFFLPVFAIEGGAFALGVGAVAAFAPYLGIRILRTTFTRQERTAQSHAAAKAVDAKSPDI